METKASLEAARLRAEISTLEAEAAAYKEEALYHSLQSQRLTRAWDDEMAELDRARIYDFTNEVSTSSVRSTINTLHEWSRKSSDPITIRFFSPGGDVFAGLALFDYMRHLRQRGIKVTTEAIGMAASMGAILLQAGDERVVNPSTYIMIHEISTVSMGKTSEIMDEVKLSNRLQEDILKILAERSVLTKKQIQLRWKRKDWWLDAEECVKAGFADRILSIVPVEETA